MLSKETLVCPQSFISGELSNHVILYGPTPAHKHHMTNESGTWTNQ